MPPEVWPSRPVGRVLYPPERMVTINLGRQLPIASSGQPGRLGQAPLALPYLALLRAGFGRPPVHTEAGGLLPHHFTLALPGNGGMFLCHFPSGHPAWALPSALPGGARTFLSPMAGRAITRPAEPSSIITVSAGTGPAWLELGPRLFRRAVEREVSQLIRTLIFRPRHRNDPKAAELASQLQKAREERP